MNSTIMMDWLQASYRHIGFTGQVLLTMGNFFAHLSGVELCPPPPNIRICWLPANSTSRFQPLDQGIIQSLKAYYRRQWLSFMLECYNSNLDPIKQASFTTFNSLDITKLESTCFTINYIQLLSKINTSYDSNHSSDFDHTDRPFTTIRTSYSSWQYA